MAKNNYFQLPPLSQHSPIPKYYQIKQIIRKKIAGNKLRTGESIPTEENLSRIFDVSKNTVVRALIDLTHEGLLCRVQGRGTFIADPNKIKKSGSKHPVIGMALYKTSFISDPYFSRIIEGVSSVLSSNGFRLQWTTTKRNASQKKQKSFFLEQAKNKHIDGLLILEQEVTDKKILEIETTGIPFVLMDRSLKGIEHPAVLIDNENGIFKSTKYLIEKGHKKIAFISEPYRYYKSKEMLKGYKLALKKHGLTYHKEFVCQKQEMDRAIGLWLHQPLPITAVVASSDKIALRTFQIVKEKALRIPDDVAIVGYNDEPIASATNPQLTTMEVPLKKMGKKAAEILLKLINGERIEGPYPKLRPRLLVRGSA